MTLLIGTTNFSEARLALRSNSGKIIKEKKFDAGGELSKKLLLEINCLLDDLNSLGAVEVATGSGSFTGVRIGVAVANALGFSLEIPVNGRKWVAPDYGKEPNIG